MLKCLEGNSQALLSCLLNSLLYGSIPDFSCLAESLFIFFCWGTKKQRSLCMAFNLKRENCKKSLWISMNRIGFLRRDICECLFFWNDIRMIVSEIWQWDCCKGGLLALISSWVDWWINVLRADGAGDRRSNQCSKSQYNYSAGSAYSTSLIAFFVRIWGLEFVLLNRASPIVLFV